MLTELFSWVPLTYSSPPGCPFPIESLALSAHMCCWTIHFWVLDKSQVSGSGRGPPSCNRTLNFKQLLRSALTSLKSCRKFLFINDHEIYVSGNEENKYLYFTRKKQHVKKGERERKDRREEGRQTKNKGEKIKYSNLRRKRSDGTMYRISKPRIYFSKLNNLI